MPWVRFADDYLSNTKVASLGPLARLLDVAAIIYSARELRDGQLSLVDVQLIATLAHIPRWQPPAAELVGVGRWIQDDGGYTIHDYLAYQPSREQVLAQRDTDRHRKRAAAGKRWDSGRTSNGTPAGKRTESRESPDAPYPDPVDGVNPAAAAAAGSPPGRTRSRAGAHEDTLPPEVLQRLAQPPIIVRSTSGRDNGSSSSSSSRSSDFSETTGETC